MDSPTVIVLRALGGIATAAELTRHVSRHEIWRATNCGEVVRPHRGVYALPPAEVGPALAKRLRGTLSHISAAAHHGLALPAGSDGEHITVPWKARRTKVPDGVTLHYRDLSESDRTAGVTSPVLTVVDCLRDMSWPVALSAGDSSLRDQHVDKRDLAKEVTRLTGPYSAVAAHRFGLLDARAENAFESSCRAILLGAGITGFRPQLNIHHCGQWIGRVDLANEELRIVIECDGFESHGTRQGWARDVSRHTRLVAAGWRPLRFTWEQVMFSPEWVLEIVMDTIALAS